MVNTYSFKKDGNLKISQHFRISEFICKDGTDTILINSELIFFLEKLFIELNAKAINIVSGYRTDNHSERIGGYRGDQHTKGNACDIWYKKQDGTKGPSQDILLACERLNHNGGVGKINNTNVHIDVRGYKCWFDESQNDKIVNSWYGYFGISDKKIKTYILTCKNINVRTGNVDGTPNPKGKILCKFYKGQLFNIYEIKNGWLRIDISNHWCKPTGYYREVG